MDFTLTTYYPIFLYLVVILGFAVAAVAVAHLVAPKKKTPVKQMPYESGMDPIGDARQRFDVKVYLIAILFLVFDVELLFLDPWGGACGRPATCPAGVPPGRVLGSAGVPGPRGRGLRLRLAQGGVPMALETG